MQTFPETQSESFIQNPPNWQIKSLVGMSSNNRAAVDLVVKACMAAWYNETVPNRVANPLSIFVASSMSVTSLRFTLLSN